MTKRVVQGEFPIGNAEQQARAVRVGARWRFIQAVSRVCPEVFECLNAGVYPTFLELKENGPNDWRTILPLERWYELWDRDHRLTPSLNEWALRFRIDEPWSIEGALQTMYYWSRADDLREALTPHGFRPFVAGSILVHEHEHEFEFKSMGWNPQFEKWQDFKGRVESRFRTFLSEYEKNVRGLAEERGLENKPPVCSDEHFEWLALFKCGCSPLKQILERYSSVEDTSTISKGLHKAADLAETEVPRRGKLKSN